MIRQLHFALASARVAIHAVGTVYIVIPAGSSVESRAPVRWKGPPAAG
jgi:hypothetical protein